MATLNTRGTRMKNKSKITGKNGNASQGVGSRNSDARAVSTSAKERDIQPPLEESFEAHRNAYHKWRHDQIRLNEALFSAKDPELIERIDACPTPRPQSPDETFGSPDFTPEVPIGLREDIGGIPFANSIEEAVAHFRERSLPQGPDLPSPTPEDISEPTEFDLFIDEFIAFRARYATRCINQGLRFGAIMTDPGMVTLFQAYLKERRA